MDMAQVEEAASPNSGLNNAELEEFAQESFSPVGFVGNVLSNRDIRQAIVRVKSASEQLKKEVERELNKNQDILISKIKNLGESESNISDVTVVSKDLLGEVERIEQLVGLPVSQARESISRIEFIYKCLGILRDLISLERYVSHLKRVCPDAPDAANTPSSGYFSSENGNISTAEEGIYDLCETAKSAQKLLESSLLSNIYIAQQQSIYVNNCLNFLDSAIRKNLLPLMEARSQVDVGNLLLGAYYLDTLQGILDSVVQELVSKVSQKIRDIFLLEQRDYSRADTISKETVWQKLLNLKESVLDGHRSVLLLEGILWRKYPWDSHKPLAAFVKSQHLVQVTDEKHSDDMSRHFLMKKFHLAIRDALKSHVEATATSTSGSSRSKLFDMLVDMYPSIWQLLRDMENSLREQLSEEDLYDSFISLALSSSDAELWSFNYANLDLVSTFYPCEAHYFAKSFSRLSYPLQQLFDNTEHSFDEDAVGGFIKLIEAEFLSNLELVESPSLFVKNLESIIDMFVAKAEQAMNSLIGQEWNPSQTIFMDKLSNLRCFYNGILLFEENLKRLPAILDRKMKHMRKINIKNKFPSRRLDEKEATEGVSGWLNPDIQSARESLSSLSCIFIDEVFEKGFDCVRHLILILHNSDGLKPSSVSFMSVGKESSFLASNKDEFENVSKTVQGLVRFLELYNSSFFMLLRNYQLLKGKMEYFISRLVLYYLRNVSVLHPITEQVKYQLLSDFATLEGFLSSLYPTWMVGYQSVYDCLRSFRVLLFSETEEILQHSEDSSAKDCLSNIYPSIVLHHLLSRWNIPKLFLFEQPDWTLKSYLYFWETHSERKVCEMAMEHLQAILPELTNKYSEADVRTLKEVPVFISEMLEKYESLKLS